MQSLVSAFTAELGPSLSPDQRALFWSLSDRWNAVFRVTYAIEFLCLSVAKLIVLDRMSDFAAGSWMGKHWVAVRCTVMASVVAGNLAGLASNIAAAVYFDRVADWQVLRAADLAVNNTAAAAEKLAQASDEYQLALFISSVQAFLEATVLLVIVLSFTVVGLASARRVRSALSILDSSGSEMAAQHRLRQEAVGAAMALGRQMQREVLVTTAVVFVTFLIRAAYSTMYAVAYKLQDFSNLSRKCPGASVCDSSCFNVFTLICFWMIRTPGNTPKHTAFITSMLIRSFHIRVPAYDCAPIEAAAAARSAVGHDDRAHAAERSAQASRDVGDKKRPFEQAHILEAWRLAAVVGASERVMAGATGMQCSSLRYCATKYDFNNTPYHKDPPSVAVRTAPLPCLCS